MKNENLLHTRYSDLLDDHETGDPALERLVTDLETIYTSISRPVMLTEVLTSKLEAHMQQNDTATVTQFPEQSYAGSARKRQLKSWQRGLTTIAAVLLTALITGSLLLVLQGARHSTHTGSGGQTVNGFNRFLSIHMTNENTGWAQASNSRISTLGVLHTTDGGANWQYVTPTQLTHDYDDNRGVLYSLDANTAWIVDVFPLQFQPTNPQNVLFRTNDAGKTWQQMTMPQSLTRGYVSKLTFLNAKTGWIKGASLGKASQDEIWQTNNGGKTWSKVNTTFPNATRHPSLSYKNITFVTEKTWWLTSSFINSNGAPIIYVTHDAGQTWQQQVLQVPSDFFLASPDNNGTSITKTAQTISANSSSLVLQSSVGVITQQPQFFSANDGILTLQGSKETIIYTTHDGGATWQLIGSLKGQNKGDRLSPAFADMNHGIAYEQASAGGKLSDTNLLVFTTSDGGKNWAIAHTQLPITKGMQADPLHFDTTNLDFVSVQTGWLIEYVRVPGANLPQTDLLHTVDGGLTWTIVNYTVYQS